MLVLVHLHSLTFPADLLGLLSVLCLLRARVPSVIDCLPSSAWLMLSLFGLIRRACHSWPRSDLSDLTLAILQIVPEFLDVSGPALRVCELINSKLTWDFDKTEKGEIPE